MKKRQFEFSQWNGNQKYCNPRYPAWKGNRLKETSEKLMFIR